MPPSFEGEQIAVTFTFRRPDELRVLAQKLAEMSGREEVEEILRLL